MRRPYVKKWGVLIKVFLMLFVTGYLVSSSLWVSGESGIRTGGDLCLTGKIADSEMNVFANASTLQGEAAVIAPGSRGSYTFTVKNDQKFPISTSLQLADENREKIPMQFRLQVESAYLFGTAKEWISGEMLEHYVITDQLAAGEEREYCLDWEWPFTASAERDAHDTELGMLAAAGEEVSYKLQVSLLAEGETEDNNESDDKNDEDGNTEDQNKEDENKDRDEEHIIAQPGEAETDAAEELLEMENGRNQTGQQEKEPLTDGDEAIDVNPQEEPAETEPGKEEQERIEVDASIKEAGKQGILSVNPMWFWLLFLFLLLMLLLLIKKIRKHLETEKRN